MCFLMCCIPSRVSTQRGRLIKRHLLFMYMPYYLRAQTPQPLDLSDRPLAAFSSGVDLQPPSLSCGRM